MKFFLILKKIIFLILFLIGIIKPIFSQKNEEKQALFNEILKADSLLFDAFNRCDTAGFRNLLTADNEFYHDKGGFAMLEKTMSGFRAGCEDDSETPRRELLLETMEVFPIPDFGAIQSASHQFYVQPKNQPEQIGGKFRFLHVWKKTETGLKLARIVSFDH